MSEVASTAFETTGEAPRDTHGAPLPVWQLAVTIAVATLVGLAIGGLGVWTLTRPELPHVARFPVPLATDQAFRFESHSLVAISPDGSQVVYEANGNLWLRPVDQLHASQILGTERVGTARGPFFSADGQSIGFWIEGELRKVSVSGGAPVTLADVQTTGLGASWTTDAMILYGQADGIWQVPGAGGTPELLIPVEESMSFYGPPKLPDGEWGCIR